MPATDIPRISIGAVITGVLLDHLATPILLAPVTFAWLLARHGGSASAELFVVLPAGSLPWSYVIAMSVPVALAATAGGRLARWAAKRAG